ncbi:MAG: nitroreductase [Bacteroidota bacterium]|nr:nitroreductase [Bacteroidota bacterium]
MKFSVSELTELIRNRRTIYPKDHSPREVHREIIEKALSNATWAPSHGMTQPWRFSVHTGKARERLSRFLGEEYLRVTPAEKVLQRKFDNLTQRPLQSSVVIAIGMARDPSGRIAELDEICATACAVQNILLTCTADGLGAFWATGSILTGASMRDHIGLGENDHALGLVFIGYPGIEWPKGHRKPLDQFVTWNTD